VPDLRPTTSLYTFGGDPLGSMADQMPGGNSTVAQQKAFNIRRAASCNIYIYNLNLGLNLNQHTLVHL